MNELEVISKNFDEASRKARSIERFQAIRDKMIEHLSIELEDIDLLIDKRRNDSMAAPTLTEKIAIQNELIGLNIQKTCLILTLYQRQDIINEYFYERIEGRF